MNYADLHLHISLKHYLNGRTDIWECKPYKPHDKPKLSKANKYDQSDIGNLIRNKVKLAVIALHPAEKVIFAGVISRLIGGQFFGLKIKRLRELYGDSDHPKSYFDILNYELNYILNSADDHGMISKDGLSAKLVEKHEDLRDEVLTKLVLSIEGSHGLASTADPVTDYRSYWNDILTHLDEIKNWKYPVFTLTLCHFTYNYLVGQSWGIPLPGGIAGMDFPGIDMLYAKDQTINEHGFELIEKALKITNGRRIYIDLKHTHIVARYQYYKWLESKDYNPRIPLIASHAGLSGRKSYIEAIDVFSRPNEEDKEKYAEFNPWEINLCDEEIGFFYESGGIIGISLDQRILGANNKNFKSRIKKHLKNAGLPKRKRKNTWWHMALFVHSISHIVQTVGHKDGWNIICIGSDFDGIIDPIDCVPTVAFLQSFEEDLIHYFDNLYMGNDYKRELFLDDQLTIEKALRLVFYENLMNFLDKHYPRDMH